jgi:Spy/CpxP family protein refolding chaperone
MRTRFLILASAVLMAGSMFAQDSAPAPAQGPPQKHNRTFGRREMGKWWQNPDTVAKLQLSESQVGQLNQVFYDHKVKLIDYGAEMEKQDLKLQTLLDADQPNEGQVGSQVDQVLAARGKVEREYTMMNLDLRKVLTVEQWRQLKSIRGEVGVPGDRLMYFHKKFGPGGPGVPDTPPPPPPPGEFE